VLQGAQEIILPPVGSVVDPEGVPMTIRNRNCALDIQVPLRGRIIDVNTSVRPAELNKNPYGAGWLVKIVPNGKQRPALLSGERALQLLRHHADAAKEFFLSATGQTAVVSMHDGGTFVEGLLARFDAKVWKEFERRFVKLSPTRNR
jgi:hypothetical protein